MFCKIPSKNCENIKLDNMCAPFAVAFAINFTDLRECDASGGAGRGEGGKGGSGEINKKDARHTLN